MGQAVPHAPNADCCCCVTLCVYVQADALVGVCRDLDQNCSKTFTFDLSRLEPPTDAL